MKRAAVKAALIAALVCGSGGCVLLNTAAHEQERPERTAYYTSIEIRQGDTLWSIAGRYAPALGLTTDEYIEDLRVMNRLTDDTIHAGRHLTVMYSGE